MSFLNTVLLLGALLMLAGILSSLIAARFGAPLLLIFLVIGMLAGENGPGGIAFNDYGLTYLVGSLALAIILFDGGLRTQLSRFGDAILPAATLATVGVVMTAALTGVLAAWLLGLSLLEGLLVGAIVSSTDAAAVFFLLRAGGMQLRRRVGATLEIESATNDPAAMFLTLVLVELVRAGRTGTDLDTLTILLEHAALGGLLGLAGGLTIVGGLNRITFPAGLHPLFVAASAVVVYAAASLVGGSGFLAAYLAGLVVGNRPVRAFASILSFHDGATWLAQIAMFLVLGLLATPKDLLVTLAPALVIAVFLMVVGRPLAVWACLLPFNFTTRERLFMSWVGLRGAVSIFLAAIPVLTELPNASMYFNVAFVVVLVSLIVQGWSITWSARQLGVALLNPAPAVQRIEIDLPGQLDLELVGYPIQEGSRVLSEKALPEWATCTLVVRNDLVLAPQEAGPLKAGDYVYFLVPPDRVLSFDLYFSPEERVVEHGIFRFPGDMKVGELEDLYGLPHIEERKEATVADIFADRFENQLRVGDKVEVGPVTLVCEEVENERAKTVSLLIVETESEEPPKAWKAVLERLLRSTRALISRI
ncbi:MAG TPA: potassium/proton antiporter [Hyphomicrobiaceae bacterium]|nr:potassium/proton antiporter [Hyphomicrobiaceae bacterium]